MDHYAVFGNPIKQSKSPIIHKSFAEQTKQDLDYEKILVEVDGFNDAASKFFDDGGKGLNITAPFKQDAYNYADELSEGAKLAGAVNTLMKRDDGSIYGENTDGIGLVSDIVDRLAWQMKEKNILMLGAGGAVRGVLYPFLKQQPQSLIVANRTVSKAEELAAHFSEFGNISGRGFNDLGNDAFDLVINGTSASLSADLPPIPESCIGPQTCVYDMVYGSELTPFLTWAKGLGAQDVSDGLGMLVGQAAESFRIWRGVMPEVEVVMEQLRSC